jgi:hypothetical protein
MRAAHQREIVGQLRGVRHKPARALIRDRESSPDSHVHEVRVVAVRVGAQIVRVEGIRREAADGRPVEREPERIHRVVAEHTGVANGQRLRQIIEP